MGGESLCLMGKSVLEEEIPRQLLLGVVRVRLIWKLSIGSKKVTCF